MKFKKSLALLMIFPLTGCLFKKTLTIPTVDVLKLKINLPALPTRNVGEMRTSDGGLFDYVDLYELSDFHGAVTNEEHSSGTYIGLQKLASYFEEKRTENQGGTIILSSGDMFQGSADSNLTRGYMVNYAMQYMGFDAMAVGNHEFDWTDEWLKNNAQLKYNTSSIPFLGANIHKNGKLPSFLKKSTIVQRGEYKIGIIGVIGSELENSILKTAIKDYEFVSYKSIVSTEADSLRAQGCDAVVLLAHEAVDNIDATGVDAIFGGHAHKDDKLETPVPSVATLNYGQSVGHISLQFRHEDKELMGYKKCEIQPMSEVSDSLENNAAVKKIMDQYAPEINKIKKIKLGTCDEKLLIGKALKNICTNTMFESAVDSAKKIKELKVDSKKIVCAFQNHSGGIRDDIKAGEITYGDVYRSFPFDNEIVMFKAKGSELADNLSRLKDLGCYRVFEDSSYFNRKETYYVVTTDYLALSSQISDFKELGDKDLIRTGKVLRDEIANKIYQLGKVKNSKWETGDYHYQPIPLIF